MSAGGPVAGLPKNVRRRSDSSKIEERPQWTLKLGKTNRLSQSAKNGF